MPKWVTTATYEVNYGWGERLSEGGFLSSNKYLYTTGDAALQASLEQLVRKLNRNQFAIKAVVPKTESLGHFDYGRKGDGGYGWGYGISQITGFVVLAQREDEISQEEFSRRKQKQDAQDRLVDLSVRHEELKERADAVKEWPTDVVEEKKMFRGSMYCVGEREFDTREEAAAHREKLLAEMAVIQERADTARKELEACQKELVELEKPES